MEFLFIEKSVHVHYLAGILITIINLVFFYKNWFRHVFGRLTISIKPVEIHRLSSSTGGCWPVWDGIDRRDRLWKWRENVGNKEEKTKKREKRRERKKRKRFILYQVVQNGVPYSPWTGTITRHCWHISATTIIRHRS